MYQEFYCRLIPSIHVQVNTKYSKIIHIWVEHKGKFYNNEKNNDGEQYNDEMKKSNKCNS